MATRVANQMAAEGLVMQLFTELKRRNVFRVALAYLAVAWLVLQAADIVLDNIAAPDWLMQALMFFMVAGFPVAVLFAWAFENDAGRYQEGSRGRSIGLHHAKHGQETKPYDHRRTSCCGGLLAGRQIRIGRPASGKWRD